MAEIIFIISTLFSIWCLYEILHKEKRVFLFGSLWLLIMGLLAYNNFFINTKPFPPRIIIAILPALVVVIWLIMKTKVDSIKMKDLIIVHLVRIPLEIGLFLLFKERLVPELMTFSGWNYDILIGLSAISTLILLKLKKLNKLALLIWNIIGICFLVFIVVLAVLSAPLPIQKLAYDQPNVAVLHFPYIWLPTFIVPIVFLAHFLGIKKLLWHMNKKP